DEPGRQRSEGFAVLISPIKDLVIDVGDVAHIGHLIAAMTQISGDDVKRHHDTGMANMAVVIHGHAAHIHGYMPLFKGLEGLFALRESVINIQHHHPPLLSLTQESRNVTVRLNTILPSRLSTGSRK